MWVVTSYCNFAMFKKLNTLKALGVPIAATTLLVV